MSRCVAVYCPKSLPESVALALLTPELDQARPDMVAHLGGTRAGDRAAIEWCARNLVPAIGMPADWHRHRAMSGEVRDRNVAAWANMVVALWDPCEGSRGRVVREALAQGKRVLLVVLSAGGEVVVDRLDTAAADPTLRSSAADVLRVLDRERVPRPRKRRTASHAA